jgi:predicted ArsR family transcriptional regulator
MSTRVPRIPVERLALLADATRRRLYEYVAGRPEPVGRDEAAAGTGTKRSLAAFHLDRLAAGGLLAVEYRRLGERSGPGAGRPAKLYRRADSEVAASAPPRDYALAADIFVDALVDAGAGDSIIRAARRRGRELGQRLAEAGAHDAPKLMDMMGYAPVADNGQTRALNCPFHLLAQRRREVTCGMNVALLDSALEAGGIGGTVKLDPRPGYCCVAVSVPTG